MLTYRCPFPPPLQQRRSRQCPQPSGDAAGNCRCGSRSLPDLTGCFTVRTDDGHAPPLSQSCKTFRLTIIQLSYPVRCPALNPIKPQAPPVVVLPRQFLQVSALRPYFPGGAFHDFSSAHQQHVVTDTPNAHCLRLGLPGYLIPFAPPAFVPHCRSCSGKLPSPQVVPRGLQDFTPTPEVRFTSPSSKTAGISQTPSRQARRFPKRPNSQATDALNPVIVAITRAAGITAAAGTGLALPFLHI
eukprot:TRINITY_DN78_c0_g1_i9.p2 TRINITY_DN78_c0_g1~~TRINITY_DN78_c0_g1_i9.p2  ORF type:complete len:243 (+),score=-28.54 TRINITY_DN78_c0_g1_i9:474-1202(+)